VCYLKKKNQSAASSETSAQPATETIKAQAIGV
jgi:hypothetical protein